ncbi:MAG: ECF transporter S component [Clostridiales bacterium]|nr:ECF transporter S component [Clostridiales bacterium]
MIVIKSPRLRVALRWAIPCIAMPVLVFLGAVFLDARHHLLVSFGVATLAVVLFIAGFERRLTGSRRMVLVAVMTALCIAGRFIPFFKPVTALTIITSMYMGGESGFLTGAMAAVLSNFYFGQGPWTPFQMLAWGMIGLIAGWLHRPLKQSRVFLLVYGALSGLIYSLMMDVWTVLWYDGGFRWELYLTALVTALPHTAMYSLSNLAFLWFLARPFGEKLERVRLKYGM